MVEDSINIKNSVNESAAECCFGCDKLAYKTKLGCQKPIRIRRFRVRRAVYQVIKSLFWITSAASVHHASAVQQLLHTVDHKTIFLYHWIILVILLCLNSVYNIQYYHHMYNQLFSLPQRNVFSRRKALHIFDWRNGCKGPARTTLIWGDKIHYKFVFSDVLKYNF